MTKKISRVRDDGMTKRNSSLVVGIKKLVRTRAGSLLFLATVGFWCLTGCSNCESSVKSKAVSPDGLLIARTCERNCGATTDFSSIVNLQSASAKYDPTDGVLSVAKGRYEMSTKWTDPKHLSITCEGCSRPNVSREVTVAGDIDVSYVLTPG